MKLDADYWNRRYQEKNTPWDTGAPTPPIRDFVDSLKNQNLKILIPGAGNGHEAAYLYSKGFHNIWVCDWAPQALERVKTAIPDLPADHLIAADYFALLSTYDLILEQTFFCSLHPTQREAYVSKTADLLRNQGRVAGVLFAEYFPFAGPPFGGTKHEYQQLFEPSFILEKLELCYNSIKPRQNRELFFNFVKK